MIMRDKSLNVLATAQATVTANNTSEKSDATQAPSKPPATVARKQSETPQIPAKPQEEQTAERPSGLFGGLSFGGVSRSAIPDLTETTMQELGLDDADDQGNGAAAKAPNTGKSRSRKRENKKVAESVEATGKTVEDAIQDALEQLGASRDAVTVRVLSAGTGGYSVLAQRNPGSWWS